MSRALGQAAPGTDYMSTILKALKKAEEGMAKNTLPGKIISSDSASGRARARPATVVLLLALAVVGGLAYHLHPPARAGRLSRQPASPPAAAPPARTAGAADAARVPALPPLRLSGVLWDETEPLAILNGRPLTVGGAIDGARVVSIGLDVVRLDYHGREYTLSVE
jgi:hypothetical protein